MKRLFSIRPLYCLFVMALFVLAGCQTSQTSGNRAPVVVKDSKELLAADEGKMMSDEEKELSPIEQHMLARKDVNPKKINRKNKYSKTVADYKAKEEKVRIVRVDEDVSTLDKEMKAKGLKIEPDPMKKQKDAKSYVQAILEKHQERQDGAKEDVKKIADSTVKPSKKPVSKVEKKPSAQSSNKTISVSRSTVKNLRVGQHPGKTRIVLDVTGKTSFQTSFESGNKVLVVSLPDAVWEGDASARSTDKSLFAGYDARSKGSGSVVKISLNSPARLAYKQAMKPSGSRGHRIVLDIVSR